MKTYILGPNNYYESGITHYTRELSRLTGFEIIYLDKFVPGWVFPGKTRGKKKPLPWYDGISWWNPLSLLHAIFVSWGSTVILQWWTSSVSHLYIPFMLLRKGRNIVEIHESVDPIEKSGFLGWYSTFTRKIILRCADKIIVHTKYDKELYDGVVIPHMMYTDYKRIPRTDCKFTVLFFGLIREYKGLDVFFESMKYIPQDLLDYIPGTFIRPINFVVAGEMWDYIEIPDKVTHYIHYLDKSEIEYIFSNSDVVVLPYKRASTSGVAHIAMHYNLPIIASDIPQFLDLENAILFKSGDPKDLADKIIHLYNNPRRVEYSNTDILISRLYMQETLNFD